MSDAHIFLTPVRVATCALPLNFFNGQCGPSFSLFSLFCPFSSLFFAVFFTFPTPGHPHCLALVVEHGAFAGQAQERSIT